MARKAVSTAKTAKVVKMPRAAKAIAKPVYVLNGPNLNLLGQREPEIYGSTSLNDIEKMVAAHGKTRGVNVLCLQSNHEGDLVTWIQEARSMAAGLIINAGAYSHTSIAVHDALAMLDIPAVEVHISNVHKREEFRHYSYMSSVVTGVICGLGVQGYTLALDAIVADLSKSKRN
jgi:3-dehydroquinate dehydratase-2